MNSSSSSSSYWNSQSSSEATESITTSSESQSQSEESSSRSQGDASSASGQSGSKSRSSDSDESGSGSSNSSTSQSQTSSSSSNSSKYKVRPPATRNYLPAIVAQFDEENVPNSIDLRVRGNEIHIGGCWGTIDVRSAVKLPHKFRGSKPLIPWMAPFDPSIQVEIKDVPALPRIAENA